MKILVVHNHYQQRGGEDVVYQLEVEMLRARGHQVTTYNRDSSDIHPNGSLSKFILAKDTLWSVDSRREVTSLLLKTKPDVVHVHNTFPLISPSIYSACAEGNVPLVQTLHNYRMFCSAGTFFRDSSVCETCLQSGAWQSIAHGCYRNSRLATAAAAFAQTAHRRLNTWTRGITRYIALTQFSKSKFIQAGLPSARIRVKPNFVHPDPGCRESERYYALFVGRLSPEKSVGTLLDAWSQIQENIPLLIVGGGPEFESLRHKAERRGLGSVRFLGQLPRAETLALMHKARFLAFTSEWYENFPMVIAESFACGVPVLCPRLGAMQDIVSNYRAGIHYCPGDASDLAEKAFWAWSHPKETRSMGREAREQYESKYTAEHNYPLLMDIYEEAIRARNAQHSERTDSRPMTYIPASLRNHESALTNDSSGPPNP